jgi:hypothetical protein
MARCSISLLIVLGMLVGPLAAIPHAHVEMSCAEQRSHDATPHVHIHAHQHHGHHHAPHRHSTNSLTRDVRRLAPEPEGHQLPSGWSHEHDAMAVFLTVETAAPAPTKQISPASPASLAMAQLFIGSDLQWGSQPALRRDWHPPDAVCDGSNRYLTLRTLRN